MKAKSQPKVLKSPNYLEYALYKGLNDKEKREAERQVEKFRNEGIEIPYGFIRKVVLEERKKKLLEDKHELS